MRSGTQTRTLLHARTSLYQVNCCPSWNKQLWPLWITLCILKYTNLLPWLGAKSYFVSYLKKKIALGEGCYTQLQLSGFQKSVKEVAHVWRSESSSWCVLDSTCVTFNLGPKNKEKRQRRSWPFLFLSGINMQLSFPGKWNFLPQPPDINKGQEYHLQCSVSLLR